MLIRDITLYCSDMDNVDGYPLPRLLEYPTEEAMATRIAMKLNEMHFDIGDYCDLKLNFTPCQPASTVCHALRTAPSKNTHYIDIGVTRDVFNQLKDGDPEAAAKLMPGVRQALLVLYGPHHPERQDIRAAIDAVLTEGEELEVTLMEKQSLFARGKLMVSYSDDGVYHARLYVTDRQGNEKLNQQLLNLETLDQIKDFQLGLGKAVVHYAYGDKSLETFSYNK